MLIREKLSKFTITTIIQSESAEDLRNALIPNIIEFIPDNGATIQVDNAPGFQSLWAECKSEGSVFRKLNIKIDLGRTLNRNKNPIAENAIKEFHKECLRLNPTGGPLTKLNLAMITKTMNERIRNRGYSSKEIAFRRDQIQNTVKDVSDEQLGIEQYDKRENTRPQVTIHENLLFTIGQNVMLKSGKSKTKGRELYRIINLSDKNQEPWATLLKSDSQLRSKQYEVKTAELIPMTEPVEFANTIPDIDNTPGSDVTDNTLLKPTHDLPHTKDELIAAELENNQTKQKRKYAIKARQKIKDIANIEIGKLTVRKQDPPLHGWQWDT